MEEVCKHLASLTQAVKNLQDGYLRLEGQVQDLSASGDATSASAARSSSSGPSVVMLPPEPRVPMPERFSGDRTKFRDFRNACQLYFALQPRTFSLEATKVGFVVSLLQGEPQNWAHRLLDENSIQTETLPIFFQAMAQLYDDPQRTATAEAALLSLQQGRRAVEDYVTDFRRWSADTQWNSAALRHQFRLGLSEALKDKLARIGVPDTLDDLIDKAALIDRRLRERRAERSSQQSRPVWVTTRAPLPPSRFQLPASSNSAGPSMDTSEPMQLGVMRPTLPPEERIRRRQLNLCLYCGEAGHYVYNCPVKIRKFRSSIPGNISAITTNPNHLALILSLQLPGKTVSVNAIVDSGACSCFIDSSFADMHNIPVRTKDFKLSVFLADGSHIKSGQVTQETLPLPAVTSSNHKELLILDVISSPLFPVILGIPWLQVHNPQIDWTSKNILFSSHYCLEHCLPGHPKPSSALLCLNTDPSLLQTVPKPYQGFLDVFSKKGADSLPPHRPYDCPIELLPGAEIPFGRIFPLSEKEQDALKIYLDENLDKGFIRPSTSPAGAGIFFVTKKDQTLRPCIDYRELNKVTVKNRYPLPLIPELFQKLRFAVIFTKLDLRGAYNLIRIKDGHEWKTAFRTRYGHYEYLVMPFGLCNAPATFQHFVNDVFRDFLDIFVIVYLDDILIFSRSLEEHRGHVCKVLDRLRQHSLYAKAEKCEFEQQTIQFLGLVISPTGIEMDQKKVSAILDWPTPLDKKGVQCFIGFANFYRKFIRGFSAIVAPITQLTKQNLRFCWNPEAQKAFDTLKRLFTSAPILRHPNPTLPFLLEVDASEVAVGAVLSQRLGDKDLIHPVGFFSRKLSPTERNYDVGDRELLAIKTALEEWRYLLEGAIHPVLIYTDHKNLEYLKSARRLKPRQARWALFFSRFLFSYYLPTRI